MWTTFQCLFNNGKELPAHILFSYQFSSCRQEVSVSHFIFPSWYLRGHWERPRILFLFLVCSQDSIFSLIPRILYPGMPCETRPHCLAGDQRPCAWPSPLKPVPAERSEWLLHCTSLPGNIFDQMLSGNHHDQTLWRHPNPHLSFAQTLLIRRPELKFQSSGPAFLMFRILSK